MNDSLLNGFLIFGLAQSIFFASLFLTKKNFALSDTFIAAMLFALALQIGFIILNLNFETSFYLQITPIIISLLYGPLLFLYVQKITQRNRSFTQTDLLHLIPFLTFFVANHIFTEDQTWYIKSVSAGAVLLGSVYTVVTWQYLTAHKKNIIHEFSYDKRINLNWLSRLVIGLLFIWIGVIVLVALHRFANMYFKMEYFFLVIPCFIFYIGYYGFKQNVIYTDQKKDTFSLLSERGTKKVQKAAYKKSSLSAERMKYIFDRLLKAMNEDELFLNEQLSLQILSNELNISKHHITQTLNEYGKQNFYDFVNIFRVEKFKKRLHTRDDKDFTLLALAFDSGFNSKSSFNRIFKKFTGMSPSEYKNSIHL